ncbi:MAG TPA: ABC transporter ATP-binding protein [Burkholderiales bacterium]|nr:ABC transporter ATP-binding protein [Burkholderiales bacterium]
MLSARQLALKVPGRTLVEQLDFELKQGTCAALLGRNGAGKSSLLLAFAGLRAIDGGAVMLDGIALPPPRERARLIGLLLQDEQDSYWGSVLDYVSLGRLPYAAPIAGVGEEARVLAVRALAALDLIDHQAQSYRSLSGGERQRARIAQLLVQDPQIYLLDEPLTHLDLGHQALVMKLFVGLSRAGRAVVMSLHEPLWAAKACDEALLLYDSGRFLHGPVNEVMTVRNIEALYGCRLETPDAGNRMHFIPA